jgi:hypothetical protein
VKTFGTCTQCGTAIELVVAPRVGKPLPDEWRTRGMPSVAMPCGNWLWPDD